ncbi:CLUMA_CG000250, isoform A [Clunio marinus]|uniref:CLUMA_CG000250, isoform A n=1 Tax=Clunio marinus TaxID=568069 RepID=A0A1J1HFR9_9DIPT|nr:CLUMA_CG000250, isoform A [Clunio marinus]
MSNNDNRMRREKNFIESYCVKITDIPIHLINRIKDQKGLCTEKITDEINEFFLYAQHHQQFKNKIKIKWKEEKTFSQNEII